MDAVQGLIWELEATPANVHDSRVDLSLYMQASFSSEAFDEVFDVWYLFELSDHEGVEVPLGGVLDGSAWAFCVEFCPEDVLDRG